MTSTINNRAKPKIQGPDAVSSFIRKTYELLEEQKFPDIVDWSTEGNALVIKKPVEFGQKVLPTYFKHNNLTSFVRQLNMYDFHKRRTQKYDHVYYHNLFQRGQKHLLPEIKRKNQESTLATIQKAIETLEANQDGVKQEAGTTNIYESHLLKKLNKDALARIAALENKIKDLTIQNQALWSQITHQNQKEDLLVSFLACFIKKKGITLDQLPKVLQNQFNLQPLKSNSAFEIPKEMPKFEDKAPLNVNGFLNLGEDSSPSTELSPYNDKLSGYNDDVSLTDGFFDDAKFKSESGSSAVSPNSNWMSQLKNAPESWGFKVEQNGFDNSSNLGKRSFEDQDIFGKGFDLGRDELWAPQKLLKLDSFYMDSNKDELANLRAKKMESFPDIFSNMDNQHLDLMNFNYLS